MAVVVVALLLFQAQPSLAASVRDSSWRLKRCSRTTRFWLSLGGLTVLTAEDACPMRRLVGDARRAGSIGLLAFCELGWYGNSP